MIKLLFVLLCATFAVCADNKLKIYFLDVGQGDSQLIVYPSGFKVLIDMGPYPNKVNETLGEILGEEVARAPERALEP